MLFSKNIRRFVSGMLFLWVISSLVPTVVLLVCESSDSMELSGNMTEDPQQEEEEKKESKKDWVLSDFRDRIPTEKTLQNTFYFRSSGAYKTPSYEVALPPPELI
ncbi:MAG: hypothetical protein KIH80_002130 [Flavobacteriia bacterium]|nr:hypothetical protein [Flavobacteriia bacterium]